MSENNMEPVSFIDSTLQLRWKLTKEEFDNCPFLQEFLSPVYTVKIGDDESRWVITIMPKGDEESGSGQVVIALRCLGDRIHHVFFQFRIETSSGYWPDNVVENLFSRQYDDDIVDFGFLELDAIHTCYSRFSSTEEFRQQFVDDEITVVATMVIDMEGKGHCDNLMEGRSHCDHLALTDEFTNDMRSLSVLDDDMFDFTIICDGQHFPCHKTLLASRSEFFRGMFRSNKDRKDMEVDDSSPEIVKTVLDFMTNGLLPKDIDAKAKAMIHLADMFLLKGLTHACLDSLVKNLSPENATETLTIADEHAPNSEQRSKILDYIKKEVAQVVKTQHWKTFVQNYPDLVTDILLTPSPCTHNL